MVRRHSFLAAFIALVFSLTLGSVPATVFAAEDAPPRALEIQPLDARDAYIIQLKDPPLASFDGGIRGLAATAIESTGGRKLDMSGTTAQNYLAHLAGQRADFIRLATERLGRSAEPGYIYDVVLNGLTLELTPAEAAAVAELPGVRRVERGEMRQLLTDRGPTWIGAPAAWGAATECAPGGNCGEGIIVGIIDTGINTDHPSFADIGDDGYNHTNPLGPGNYKGWCSSSVRNPPLNKCNDKLIGLWSYANSGNNPEDPDGHGSHTASTAAGNRSSIAMIAPTISLPFDISGVAPHANIIAYDACAAAGCYTTDLVAALNQAAVDGVDVVNYSISGSSESPWVALDEQAFLNLRNAGVFVAASAGNSGPGAATVAHGSPWVTTVAASTHDRALVNAVTNLTTSQNTVLPDIDGRSATAGLGTSPIVYAGSYGGNNLCMTGVWGPGTFSNQIVVCDRGTNDRVEKAQNVQAAGGDGIVLVNAASNGEEVIGDAYVIPGVHIGYNAGVTLKAWLSNGNTGHVAAIQGTTPVTDPNMGDVMAAFSSRGFNPQAPDILKPDITAPGVDILASWATIGGVPAPEFAFLSGTSMSSPHMAGTGALMMKARYPAWSISEIQSALMTTAVFGNTIRKEDGITPADPFDRGAGRVSIANALNAGLLLHISPAEYAVANPALGGDPKTLNLASMADDACYGSCSWSRTVRNPTGQTMTWNGEFIGRDGLGGALSVPSFTLASDATQTLGVSITNASSLTPGQWYFGHVVYTEASGLAPQVHFPVAVKAAYSTDATVVGKTAMPVAAAEGAQITYAVTLKNNVAVPRTFDVSDVVPPGSTYVTGSATGGWTYNAGANTLSGSIAVGTAGLVVSEQSLGGYLSMALLGIPPANLATINRDSGCFSLPGLDFHYLGQHYTNVIVSMNGVTRAGVPASGLCPSDAPQDIPLNDPTDANDNVIAPFWADLDLTGGGNMYLALVTHNSAPHTVIEWENVRIKETNQRVTFQIWIQDGTDNIWFAYPAGFNAAVGSASPTATIGAENALGTLGAKYYRNGVGILPTGASDVWVGLAPATTSLGFQVNATAPANSNILNEAVVTVDAGTNSARANTRICGPAPAVQPSIAIQAERYTLTEWPGSVYDRYELWRSTTPYVAPATAGSIKVYGGAGFSFADGTAPVVGDPLVNHYYTLRTLNCTETSSADSSAVGEFDFTLTPGQ